MVSGTQSLYVASLRELASRVATGDAARSSALAQTVRGAFALGTELGRSWRATRVLAGACPSAPLSLPATLGAIGASREAVRAIDKRRLAEERVALAKVVAPAADASVPLPVAEADELAEQWTRGPDADPLRIAELEGRVAQRLRSSPPVAPGPAVPVDPLALRIAAAKLQERYASRMGDAQRDLLREIAARGSGAAAERFAELRESAVATIASYSASPGADPAAVARLREATGVVKGVDATRVTDEMSMALAALVDEFDVGRSVK